MSSFSILDEIETIENEISSSEEQYELKKSPVSRLQTIYYAEAKKKLHALPEDVRDYYALVGLSALAIKHEDAEEFREHVRGPESQTKGVFHWGEPSEEDEKNREVLLQTIPDSIYHNDLNAFFGPHLSQIIQSCMAREGL
jgi:hypothetical protein